MGEYTKGEEVELQKWFAEIQKNPKKVDGLQLHIKHFGTPSQKEVWDRLVT